MAVEIHSALSAYRLLNGVFCVYKPKFVSHRNLRMMLLKRLCQDLNQMQVRPLKEQIVITENPKNPDEFNVQLKPNLADSPAVLGPRYQTKDLTLHLTNYAGYDVSGLTVVGIRSAGCWQARRLQLQRHLREYEIEGKLGYATDNFMHDGKVIEKSTFSHLTRPKVDFILNKIQSAQQSAIYAELDLKTQSAYEMASQGPVKPSPKNTISLIYSLECIKFRPPDFAVRLTTLNENNLFLKNLINGIGLELRTNACVTNLRCTKFGPFSVDKHALLQKYWDVEHVMQSIQDLKPLVDKMTSHHSQDKKNERLVTADKGT